MKLLILTALVATSMGWSTRRSPDLYGHRSFQPRQTSDTRYEPGTAYQYQYESQVMTGLPTFSKQYAGIKIRCDLTLTVGSADSMTMEMKSVKVYTINNEIQEVFLLPPSMQLPVSKFQEMPSAESQLIVGKLQLPLEFEYKDNKVVSMKVADEETNWSIDIKRVVLSMLQVRLQSKTPRVDRWLKFSDLSSQNATTFDDVESGLEGTCYSTFHTYVNESAPANTYGVIKVRDQTKCIKRNVVDKTAFQQQQSNCDCRQNMDNKACQCTPVSSYWNSTQLGFSSSRTEYEVTSTDQNKLVIKRAVMSVQLKIEAPHKPHEFLLITSNHTLVLTSQTPAPSYHQTRVASKSVAEPWRMEVLPREEEKLMMSEAELIEQIEKQLEEVETVSTQPERLDDHMVLLPQLVENVRLCTRPQLDKVFNKLKADAAMRKRMQTLVDAMKVANTTVVDKMLIEKIKSGELKTYDATAVLIQWAAEKVATLEIINELKSSLLPQSYIAAPIDTTVHRHAMLCFGAMVRRLIHNEEIMIDQCVLPADKARHQAIIDSCSTHFKYLEGRLDAAKDDEEKITCLKSLANMGSITSLASVIRNRLASTESNIVRIEAINSLTNLGFQDQLQVLQTLMPIMMNRNEETSVRVAAFMMLMKCRSVTPLVELQKTLNTEQDIEFKTFVVKHMKNVLEKQEVRNQLHQMRVRDTLQSVRAFRMSERTTDWQILYGVGPDGDLIKLSEVDTSRQEVPEYFSIRQYSKLRNQYNHLVELGYRAEGLSQNQRPSSMQTHWWQRHQVSQAKPSITFFVRILGQEVSFFHVDSTTLAKQMRYFHYSGVGEINIPVKVFTTMWLQPRRVRSLQPSGGYMTEVHAHVAIIDIEGTLKIDLSSVDRLPTVTFESTKRIRASVSTQYSVHFDTGFAATGFASSIRARTYTESPRHVIHYNMQDNYLSLNWTNPGNNQKDSIVELMARSVTFVQPKRLPVTSTRSSDVCKELKVDESGRRQFNVDIPTYKSVEMEGKLEGDVNMPELVSFVRDRLQLLPTYLSTYKQHIKLRVRPAKPEIRVVATHLIARFLNVSELQQEDGVMRPEEQLSDGEYLNMFYRRERTPSQWNRPETPLSSLGLDLSVSVASVLDNQVLNMSANYTTHIESGQPIIHSLLRMERPPITSESERESVQLTNQITSTLSTESGEISQSHQISWGPKSQPEQRGMTATLRLRPIFKNNQCLETSAYGCKDEYGVVYPMWYNNSLHVETKNTEFSPETRERISTVLMNAAESVFVFASQEGRSGENSLDVDVVVRPMENNIDVIVRKDNYVSKFARIHAPTITKIHQHITENRQPNSTSRLSRSFIGTRTTRRPQEGFMQASGSVCTYNYPSLMTFDSKHVVLPRTSCEIKLVGSCQGHSLEFAVTVQPATDATVPKMLKVVVGSHMIQVHTTQNRIMNVAIDGRTYTADELRNKPIIEQGRQVALIKWQGATLEVDCNEHGAQIILDQSQLTIEMDESSASTVCGMCSPSPSLPSHPSLETVMDLTRRHSVIGRECHIGLDTMQERSHDFCQSKHTYMLVRNIRDNNQMMKCVTREPQLVCSSQCSRKTMQMKVLEVSCVSEKVAQQISIIPLLQDAQMTLDNEQVVRKMHQIGKPRTVHIVVHSSCN